MILPILPLVGLTKEMNDHIHAYGRACALAALEAYEEDYDALKAENERLREDAERYRLVERLFPIELERLLRSHLGISGGTVATLADAAIGAAKEKP